MANLKVKVKRQDLIDAIQAKADQCIKDWEQSTKTQTIKQADWKRNMLNALKEGEAKVKAANGKKPISHYDVQSLITNVGAFPGTPTKPSAYKNLISMLKMGATEEITIDQETFTQYMTTCER